MSKYLELLATGVVVARKIWVNENSKKDQVTVQVAQKIKLPEEATVLSNKIAALSQGFNPDTVGYNTVTALISMKKEVAGKNIYISNISPSVINTGIWNKKNKKLNGQSPEEVASIIYNSSTKKRTYVENISLLSIN